VPIYDVRSDKSFDFLPSQLRKIGTLPRWESENDSDGDLAPNKYVATIGYTVNTFSGGGKDTGMQQMPAVLLNIMFVLVLGLTKWRRRIFW
jgi:hypothetical protein